MGGEHGTGNPVAAGSTPATATARVEAIVRGRVQGVYFRQYTMETARALRLTGWVANLRNGTVKVVAEGPRPALEKLVAWLHHGPAMAAVDGVDLYWSTLSDESREFTRFEIRH